jgi:hypothetical protein
MSSRLDTHERIASGTPVQGSSDRSFGIVFTVVFAIIGLWPLIGGAPLRW